MLFKVVLSALALTSVVSAAAASKSKEDLPVYTATRVFQTLTDVAPYVTATTTVTWTASPSTTFAHPTGPGL